MRNIAPPSPAETLQGGANSRTSPHYVRTIHIKHPTECPFALGLSLHVLPRRIKWGARLGVNRLTFDGKYGIIISPINKNL